MDDHVYLEMVVSGICVCVCLEWFC